MFSDMHLSPDVNVMLHVGTLDLRNKIRVNVTTDVRSLGV